MNETSQVLSIIAYYLSEYDIRAVNALGYKNRTQAFKDISIIMNRNNNYLKLRRDEFDALPDSLSQRNGWKNRPAAHDVVELAAYLKDFSFEQITEMVKALISNQMNSGIIESENVDGIKITEFSEDELEQILNFKDFSAAIKVKISKNTLRVYNTSIILQLKKLYKGKCQICGCTYFETFQTDICEAHHIDYFANSHNNNANNIIILCPNHHRLIHKMNPRFDCNKLEFIYPNNTIEKIRLNLHLN